MNTESVKMNNRDILNKISDNVDNYHKLYIYIIHDLVNHCDGQSPRSVKATSLDEAYYQAYLNDVGIKCILEWYDDYQYLSGLNDNFEPLKDFNPEKYKKEIIKSLKKCEELQMVKVSESLVN